jgi:3-methyladenine DNA glycosylase AlkD
MASSGKPGTAAQVQVALTELKRLSTKKDRDNLTRFGITAGKAYGVSMRNIQLLARRIGRNHDLAAALWKTGWYEARLLTSFVDDPAKVTPAQMDRWCHDFDNWGICDTVCFHLFDRTPHAWAKVEAWHDRSEEFVKRGAFALLASLALHDKVAGDAAFVKSLAYVERASDDERNFVKKGVSWALRLIGRRSVALHTASMALAMELADSEEPAARWLGKDAIRDLSKPAVKRVLARRTG